MSHAEVYLNGLEKVGPKVSPKPNAKNVEKIVRDPEVTGSAWKKSYRNEGTFIYLNTKACIPPGKMSSQQRISIQR